MKLLFLNDFSLRRKRNQFHTVLVPAILFPLKTSTDLMFSFEETAANKMKIQTLQFFISLPDFETVSELRSVESYFPGILLQRNQQVLKIRQLTLEFHCKNYELTWRSFEEAFSEMSAFALINLITDLKKKEFCIGFYLDGPLQQDFCRN